MNFFSHRILVSGVLFCLLAMLSSQSLAETRYDNSVVSPVNYLTDVVPYNPQLYTKGLANEVGVEEALSYVSDLSTYWSYTSLHYYRLNCLGRFGGRINSAHRYGSTAVQYQAEAYPVLYKGAYAALTAAYANTTQTLFASYQYRAEGYFPLPQNFEFSLGQGTQRFTRFNNKHILLFTGSLAKSISNYYMWVRPNYFTPVSALYLEIGVRRLFDDPNRYISIKAGSGKLPDIGDLPPLDNLITMTQQALGIGGQFPLVKNVYASLDASYAHQVYPSGLVRNISTGFLGLMVQFD